MVAAQRRARLVHSLRFLTQQRLHFAAFLIVIAALPLRAADVSFNPAIADADFAKFCRIIGQGIYPTPVEPARATGLLGFDVGVAATLVHVDTNAAYYRDALNHDISTHGYVGVPRIVASKGFIFGTVSATYAKLTNSGIKTYGGNLDVPIINGGIVRPTLALRGSYATLTGADVFHEKVYGLEAFLSKGFGPLTPYAAIGRMRTDARGTIPAATNRPEIDLASRSNLTRYTAGLRISFFLPKLVVEATQAETRSYAAKISIGL
jgi:hypothetical protein